MSGGDGLTGNLSSPHTISSSCYGTADVHIYRLLPSGASEGSVSYPRTHGVGETGIEQPTLLLVDNPLSQDGSIESDGPSTNGFSPPVCFAELERSQRDVFLTTRPRELESELEVNQVLSDPVILEHNPGGNLRVRGRREERVEGRTRSPQRPNKTTALDPAPPPRLTRANNRQTSVNKMDVDMIPGCPGDLALWGVGMSLMERDRAIPGRLV
ncbi:unnamed protein product [Pleuronectes platessa]|uniref:Uncharacterized protein n=1 Tax=Pleuronectes platessa TaxID=8262 RepID=A0A9N7V7H2_PLEPL|nr:unnamed protein product [Pleuronectes platessa]